MNMSPDRAVKAVRVIVTGTVQGVWFRAHTENKARELGVAGYVRNLPDGSVEIVAEGAADAVDGLVEWSWTGSPHARVTAVELEEQQPLGLSSFATRY